MSFLERRDRRRGTAIEKTFDTLERKLDAVARERGELTLTIPMACIEAEKSRRTA